MAPGKRTTKGGEQGAPPAPSPTQPTSPDFPNQDLIYAAMNELPDRTFWALLDWVGTDKIDAVTSKAFGEKLATLRQLDSLIAQQQETLRRMEEYERFYTKIAGYLRTRYSREIETGQHSGLSLENVVMRYLDRERNSLWTRLRRKFGL